MRAPDEFDQFYKEVRSRLLLLTYCLTGDLPASRAAVRDAFVVCAHHWRKVSRYDDPEAWVRGQAFTHALRRHTAKLWHREKGLAPDVKATLDALGRLPVAARKVLLLTELTTASLGDIAREVGLPRVEVESLLQTATAQLALRRDVPTTSIRRLFEPIRRHADEARWPRATIVRRAGDTRRRTHTVIGTAVAVAALVATGAVVTDHAGVRPTLSGGGVIRSADDAADDAATEPPELPGSTLLPATAVADAVPAGRWRMTRTDTNAADNGRAMPCQEQRYADPRGTAALFRHFASRTRSGPAPSAVQATEASRTPAAAGRAFHTALAWFAGCTDDRAQLIATRRVDGLGDEAMLVALRTWGAPRSTLVAGVARAGRYTTSTVTSTPGTGWPALRPSARLLARGVSRLCDLPDAGRCRTRPRLVDVPPVPVASVTAMLAEVDLPPVAGVDRPWVGTEPRQARTNPAATTCDRADFDSRGISEAVTRTFLIPHARLPVEFGLSETAGRFRAARAASFVDAVRDRLGGCADRRMGTHVAQLRNSAGRDRDLAAWRVTAEISDERSVSYLMGIVRDGRWVAQVGFVPAGRHTISRADFLALTDRALTRLSAATARGFASR